MYTNEELKKLPVKDLQEELHDARKKYMQEKNSISVGQSKTTHKKSQFQKYIARILTFINNK